MMVPPTPDGTVDRRTRRVRLERRLAATPERAWAAWTDPQRIGRWLGPVVSGTPGEAAVFVVQMAPGETATCTVRTWDPPRLLELTWAYTGESPSHLRLELWPDDAGTRLVLDHRLPADADPVDYGAGWHLHLDSLFADLAGRPRPALGGRFPALRAAYEAMADDRPGASGTGNRPDTHPDPDHHPDGGTLPR